MPEGQDAASTESPFGGASTGNGTFAGRIVLPRVSRAPDTCHAATTGGCRALVSRGASRTPLPAPLPTAIEIAWHELPLLDAHGWA
jgi:hypothetical protein